MNPAKYRQFFQSKLEIARFLIHERGNEAEPDAEILLCCAFSGLAAILWPGRNIDKQRFVQLLVEFSTSKANLQLISTPVLASKLKDDEDVSTANELSKKFYPHQPKEILNPRKVDQDESVVSEAFKSLGLKTIRRASYASIIYQDLRCALIHEYNNSPYIMPLNMFDSDKPYYMNMTFDDGRVRHLLHIPFDYLADTLDSTTDALFTYWSESSEWEKPQPISWWIDGTNPHYDSIQ
jgi:hypothetical protein